jgi:hypothetical protein
MPKHQAVHCKMLVDGKPGKVGNGTYVRAMSSFFKRTNASGSRIAIFPHSNPDIDSICAAEAARQMIPNSQILYTGSPVTSVLKVAREFSIDMRPYSPRSHPREFSHGIAIDTSDSARIPAFYHEGGRLIGLFNHKSGGDLDASGLSIKDQGFSSTCEFFAYVLMDGDILRPGHADSKSRRMANLLAIGMIHDTYYLSLNIKGNGTFDLLARLLVNFDLSYDHHVAPYLGHSFTKAENSSFLSLVNGMRGREIGRLGVAVFHACSDFEIGMSKFIFKMLPFDVMVSLMRHGRDSELHLRSKGALDCGRAARAIAKKFSGSRWEWNEYAAMGHVPFAQPEEVRAEALAQITLLAQTAEMKLQKTR